MFLRTSVAQTGFVCLLAGCNGLIGDDPGEGEEEIRKCRNGRNCPPDAASPAAPLAFDAVADAYVDDGVPSTNFGAATRLLVDTGPNQHAYLRFAPAGLPGPVARATLRVHVVNGSADGPTVYQTGTGWTEGGITWSNRPSRTSGILADLASVSATWIDIDVTAAVGGDGAVSFELAPTSSDGMDLDSRETANVPRLIVETSAGGGGGSGTPDAGALDAGAPDAGVPPPVCGDSACNGTETCSSCAADCGACPVGACGNGTCEAAETCASCASDCGACPATAGTVVRGPYLQRGTPSAVVVRWRTDVATDSVVRYGQTAGSPTAQVVVSGTRTEHEVTVTGLAADTRYYYSVGRHEKPLAGGDAATAFTTAPPRGTARPTRIWVLGDSGTAGSSARAVKNAYTSFAGGPRADVWLMLGDNAYPDGTDSEYQAAVFAMYPEYLRAMVLWPTLGNHDGHTADSATQTGAYYASFTLPRNAEAGGVASGTEAYYSFDWGNVHFVCLESYETNRSASGAMMTWLVNDLEANTQPWTIAYWHHPPYSKGSHDSDTDSAMTDMREIAVPILESYGVDLVLTGHSHSYERSYLLHGHYGLSSSLTASMLVDSGDGRVGSNGAYDKSTSPAGEGAVYVVAGSSGQTSSAPVNHPAMYIGLIELGSVVLDIDGRRLDAKFLTSTGAIHDFFTIVK